MPQRARAGEKAKGAEVHSSKAWAEGRGTHSLLQGRAQRHCLLAGGQRNPLTLGTQKGFRRRVRPSTQKGFRKETPSSAPRRVSEERATSTRKGPSVGAEGCSQRRRPTPHGGRHPTPCRHGHAVIARRALFCSSFVHTPLTPRPRVPCMCVRDHGLMSCFGEFC